MEEIWKDIEGYQGLYQISNQGRVKRLAREFTQKHSSGVLSHYKINEQILKCGKNKNGYLYIDLHKNQKVKRCSIHRLVAKHFIDNNNNYKYINHKDNDPTNNNVNNLEWCTQSYNIKYAYDNGNKIPPHMKKVYQILNNKIINTYNSISEATRITNIKNIGKCCRNERNHAGGYLWKYVE